MKLTQGHTAWNSVFQDRVLDPCFSHNYLFLCIPLLQGILSRLPTCPQSISSKSGELNQGVMNARQIKCSLPLNDFLVF